MAEEIWPIPKFHFRVTCDALGEIGFQEVSGLEMETQFIEYRSGNDPTFLMQKIPGLKSTSIVRLSRGLFQGNNDLWDWYNDVQANPERRENVLIELLNEDASAPLFSWTIVNAFPVKITMTDMKSDANEIAIESLELAHQGITQTAE